MNLYFRLKYRFGVLIGYLIWCGFACGLCLYKILFISQTIRTGCYWVLFIALYEWNKLAWSECYFRFSDKRDSLLRAYAYWFPLRKFSLSSLFTHKPYLNGFNESMMETSTQKTNRVSRNVANCTREPRDVSWLWLAVFISTWLRHVLRQKISRMILLWMRCTVEPITRRMLRHTNGNKWELIVFFLLHVSL